MLKFLADENFHGGIVKALNSRCPRLDIVRVQDAGLSGADDPTILAWAAGYVLASQPLLVLFLLTMRAFIAGLTSGALKA